MTDIPEAFNRHAEAPHVNTPEVRAALNAGAFSISFVDLVAPACHLAEIYGRRAAHLEQQGTEDSQRLAADIGAFCRTMKSLPGEAEVAASAVAFESGRVLIVWEAMPSRQFVGAISIADQHMLAD